jgi:membrane fusion protein (multidrug efflux system)
MSNITALLLAWKWYVIAGLAIVVVGGGITMSMLGNDTAAQVEDTKRSVEVATVADIMSGGSSLSAVAEIQSVSEAKISPEAGGRIVRVNASLGQRVGAGQVLAEIENASQRAAVLQAEGVLDAAKASAGGSEGSALATILSAYAAVDNAVNDAVKQINTDPTASNPSFSVSTRDTVALAEMERIRPAMEPILRRHESQAKTVSETSNLTAELATLEGELRAVRTYLDTVLKVLNAGVVRADMPIATISAYVADVSAARTNVTASLSAVISARTSLDPQGAVSVSAATVKQAQGAYNAALAALEKTIIRSPIAGTLNNFTIKLGDTVAAQQEVAIVSNNAALEAVVYVTEEDKDRIAVGQKVGMEGGIEGTITKIAPALDPVTRRIEVRIGLPSGTTFTNGQSVRVELAKSGGTTPAQSASGPIAIPITAIKVEAERTIVYTVADGKLAAKEITIGKLSGESVQVTAGLAREDEIVVDARGLKEGQEVEIR